MPGWIGLCYNKDVLTIIKLDIIIIIIININILWQPGIMALVIRRPLLILISKSCLYLSKLMFWLYII